MVNLLIEVQSFCVRIGNVGSLYTYDSLTFFPRFIEGDFDTYTRRMRQPHVWGGEPELLMASHVLRYIICFEYIKVFTL